jgi:hypothetical protein
MKREEKKEEETVSSKETVSPSWLRTDGSVA